MRRLMLLVGSEGLTRRTISEIPDCRRQTARRLRRVGAIEGVEIRNSDGRWIVARLRNRRFRLFKRRITFTPLPEGTRYPFEE